MPHSLDAEMSVIGAMLMDQQAISTAMEILSPDDFYSRQYGIMFETITDLERAGMAVDPVTLQAKLKEKNLPPETYSTEAIASLIAQVPTSANVASYARIVADKSMLRRLIRMNEDIANEAYMEQDPPEKILEKAEEDVFRLSEKRNASDFVPIRQIVLNAMRKIEIASQMSGNITGVATGFTDLDAKTAGLQPSDLILLAARPSMGKTALALNIAEYVGVRCAKHVAIFSQIGRAHV